jgi:outer membrane autotransporter protein
LASIFDGIAKVNQLDLSIRSLTRPVHANPDGDSFSGSAEIGYGFAAGDDWSITPQAQLIATDFEQENFSDGFGLDVSTDESNSLVGRLGIQVQNSIATASGGVIAPYAIANLYSNFDGETVSYVSGTRLVSDIGGTCGSIGGGITASPGTILDLYASGDYRFGDVEGWNGTVGVKALW